MKRNKAILLRIIVATLSMMLLPATISLATTKSNKSKYKSPSKQVIATLLNWVPSPVSGCSLCGGYFKEPKAILDHPSPAPYRSLPTTITARGPTIFSKKGASILQKDVRITQTGRITRADKAYIYRDPHSGKIVRIRLVGHVRIQEHDKLLTGTEATLHLKDNTSKIQHIAYRMTQDSPYMGKTNAWGTAEKGQRLANQVISLDHSTYTTCSPLHPTWIIKAKHIALDHIKKQGVAKNVVLKLKGIPILYTPYLSFSTDHSRKSGLLSPVFEHSSKNNGLIFGIPYYWNIAPNKDMTITPIYYSKRGIQFDSLFRYLTPHSIGDLYLSYLPYDKKFSRFKRDTLANHPNPMDSRLPPYLNELAKDKDYRGYIEFSNHSDFQNGWRLSTNINYVTDDYYFRDFGTAINNALTNQLLNQFKLDYTGAHWQFTFLTQAFQTLHLIGQLKTPTVNQYMRLPELDTLATYPNIFAGINFDLSMQAVNFAYHSAFPPMTNTLPIGQRYHIRPTFSRPFNWAEGYLIPSISVDSTSYNIERPQPGQTNQGNRTLPIVDIDSGLYFDRHFHFADTEFIQTLEPRLFYLYVPFKEQNQFPIYDTQLLPFTYAQLFSLNRFIGFDRLQNANQLSLGLTSRILRASDATQLLNAHIGIGHYFTRPKVCLAPGCNFGNPHWTPLVSELSFYPTPHWAFTSVFAWDPSLRQTNNIQIHASYTRDNRHVIGAGYTFIHATPNLNTISFGKDSALYDAFFAWPLADHWSIIGHFYYNVTAHRPENYFAGLQYNSCCLAVRFITGRTFLESQPSNNGTRFKNRYDRTMIFQIQLKGIGSAGNRNLNDMLENKIPGYLDPFKY